MPVGATFGASSMDLSTPEGYSSAIQEASFFNGLNYKGQRDVIHNLQEQSFNASEAQKARDWDLMLSNTQYQRAVEDMKKAGLNPASLTAGGISSGGSSASGPSASGSNKQGRGGNGAQAAALIGQFFLSLIKIAATAG